MQEAGFRPSNILPDPEPTDIIAALEETIPMLEAQGKMSKVDIVRDFEQDVPRIMLVKDKIMQVVVNLCNNAMDAMRNGGTLTLSVRKLDGSLELRIKDTGTGISENVKKHIFEPFFTTKEVGKGTGLGLSLSYDIITKLHGTMEFESLEGLGTTFIIRFPIVCS